MAEREWKKSLFVPVTMTDKDRAAVKTWAKTVSDVSEMMLRIIEEGYKLTFSYDDRNSAHVVWFIPTHPKNENAGLILPGRGRTPTSALVQALWLHFTKYKAIWPKPREYEPEPLWDDE